jgi:hypothetical protein
MSDDPQFIHWLPAIIGKWTRPRAEGPEVAFREGAIRVAYPLIAGLRPIVILYRHAILATPLPESLSVEVLVALWIVPAALSAFFLYRGKITLSGVFLVSIMGFADILGVIVNGYWDSFLRISIILDGMIASVLMPTCWKVHFIRPR